MGKKRGQGEGSVYHRQDGRWAASITLHDGHRRTFYARTRADVASKLQNAQNTVSQGLPIAGGRLTVGAWLERWLQDSAAQVVRPKTFVRYQEIAHLHLIPRLGRTTLARLTPADVERMMRAGLEAEQSPQSVAHHRAVLRTALSSAMRHGLVGRNVAALADAPHIPQKDYDALTPTRAQAILEAVKGEQLEALFTLALACGLRSGEALALTWDEVNLVEGTLAIKRTLQRVRGEWKLLEPKTRGSRRAIFIPAPVALALRRHQARQGEERLRLGSSWEGERWGGLVFSDAMGRPLTADHVLRRFRSLLKAAGLPPMRFHDLRHGAASLMAAIGIPPRVAMEVLGHSQIATTMNRYAHIAPEWQREAMGQVSKALWG